MAVSNKPGLILLFNDRYEITFSNEPILLLNDENEMAVSNEPGRDFFPQKDGLQPEFGETHKMATKSFGGFGFDVHPVDALRRKSQIPTLTKWILGQSDCLHRSNHLALLSIRI